MNIRVEIGGIRNFPQVLIHFWVFSIKFIELKMGNILHSRSHHAPEGQIETVPSTMEPIEEEFLPKEEDFHPKEEDFRPKEEETEVN